MTLAQPAPQKPQITVGKFANVDLRVARVLRAPRAEGTAAPCRVFHLDLGHLGQRTTVGQYALVDEDELLGRNVVACVNLGTRQIAGYESQVLILGTPHPHGSPDSAQATPLFAAPEALPGEAVF